MKTKKHAKKNRSNRINSSYTPGRNMFGEKAETHFVVLKRETAFEQMMDCACQFDGSTKEFTFDTSCFIGHEEECDQIMAKVNAFLALKASLAHNVFFDCSDLLDKVA